MCITLPENIYLSQTTGNYGRAKASPQTNLDISGQQHFLKAYLTDYLT